eukprot:m51a1_g13573 hypothetical protein (181) ;mRNA; f:258-876
MDRPSEKIGTAGAYVPEALDGLPLSDAVGAALGPLHNTVVTFEMPEFEQASELCPDIVEATTARGETCKGTGPWLPAVVRSAVGRDIGNEMAYWLRLWQRPQHKVLQLFDTIQKGDIKGMCEKLHREPELLLSTDEYENTVLGAVLRLDDPAVVLEMILELQVVTLATIRRCFLFEIRNK